MTLKTTAETHWFVFYNDALLLTENGEIPVGEQSPVKLQLGSTVHHLVGPDGCDCRAVAVDTPPEVVGFRSMPLRATFDVLPPAFYRVAGKARELLYWDARSRFCGVCGAPMVFHTEISKRCSRCGVEVWPQLATAIIVAVTRGDDEILLVQSNKFKGDYLGLVAGFVETGETLEECVHREVMEETHLSIKNVTYFGSQPWPYPCGLMVGFTAEYAGGDLQLQRSELNKGGWYRRDSLPPIPGKVSLARRLIDHWMGNGCDIIR